MLPISLNIFLQANTDLLEHFIFWSDFILLPIYLLIIINIFNNYADKHYPEGHPWRKYFKMGFYIKIAGAIGIGLVYQYYYQGGDTSYYYYHARLINSSFFDSPRIWFGLLTNTADPHAMEYHKYIHYMLWYEAPSEYLVCKITTIISIVGLQSFLVTSVLFAVLAFPGAWMLFKTFAEKFPQISRYIAVAILFLPSVVMWGSGIFKDTICMSALGWLTYSSVKLFVDRKFQLKYFVQLFLASYLIIQIKVYILMAFGPSLFIWLLFIYSSKLKSAFVRILNNIGILALSVAGFIMIAGKFSEELGQYSLEKITETSATTRDYLASISQSDNGSSYSLGSVDPTPLGMLKKFPAAVNVTLFRPYIWESRKPMVFLNAIEIFCFLLLTIKVFVSVGIRKSFQTLRKDPNILFFFVFTIIFAFAVGITSMNFGALSRYRIPCLPFFLLMLVFIYYKNKPITNDFFKFNFK